MARHWISLLQAMVADGEQRIGELPMLAADEQQVLVSAWNQTAQAYPTERGIHQLIEDQVRATPDAPALVFGATTLTYAQLDARANQLAHALREQGWPRCPGGSLPRAFHRNGGRPAGDSRPAAPMSPRP
jgi:non-ribosomal peptide synthetase component F